MITVLKKYEKEIGIGVFFLSIFLSIILLGVNNLLSSFSLAVSWVGAGLFLDYFVRKKAKMSILAMALAKKSNFMKMAFLFYAFSFILDLFGHYTTRLWYYPYIPYWIFIPLTPITYVFYGILVFTIYEFIKGVLNRFVKPGRMSTVAHVNYSKFMYIIATLAWIALIICAIFAITNVAQFQMNFYETHLDSFIGVPVWYTLIILPSLFILLEFVTFMQKKESFFHSLFRKDFVPLIALLLSNFVGILLVEMVNAPIQIWVFSNWPLNDFRIFNIPLLVWITWPGNYLICLSLVRIAFEQKEIDIW